MDEPLGALDKQLREHLQFEIKALHERLGVTIIYVTHDQQEALVMSDRIAVMNEGKVEQIGSPTELYDAPATRFVASFIGESNFLEGRLLEAKETGCVVEVAGLGPIPAPARSAFSPPADVAVTIRPEKIVFADETAPPEMTCLEATIDDVIFAGEMRRYQVRLGGGQSLVLKRQNRAGARQHDRGDTVRVAWHTEDCRVV